MRRNLLLSLFLLTGACLFSPATETAQACPMCKAATEDDADLPRAYMYSILFMLAVPATIFSGIGVSLYRLNKQENAFVDEMEYASHGDADQDS